MISLSNNPHYDIVIHFTLFASDFSLAGKNPTIYKMTFSWHSSKFPESYCTFYWIQWVFFQVQATLARKQNQYQKVTLATRCCRVWGGLQDRAWVWVVQALHSPSLLTDEPSGRVWALLMNPDYPALRIKTTACMAVCDGLCSQSRRHVFRQLPSGPEVGRMWQKDINDTPRDCPKMTLHDPLLYWTLAITNYYYYPSKNHRPKPA